MNKILIFLTFVSLFHNSNSQTTLDWIPFSESPNYQVFGLSSFQGKLITSGRFDSIGNFKMNGIAKWDGSAWSSFGRGLRGGNYVFGTIGFGSEIFNNELYVWGDFDSVETIAAGDIAKWDGNNWTNFGSLGTNGIIYSAAIYNNELYIAGEFGNIGNLATGAVAKWNGTNWLPLAINHSLSANYIASLCVYNNELYAAGYIPSLNGNPCHNIVRWNGTVWDTVAGGLPWQVATSGLSLNEPKYCMIVWNGKLIVGSGSKDDGTNHTIELRQWDGTNWSPFSTNTYPNVGEPSNAFTKVRKLVIRQNQLYACGGILPDSAGTSHVYLWSQTDNSWKTVGHGPNYSVRALAEYNGELYCGGLFEKKQGSYFNYLAKLGNVTGLTDETQIQRISIYPSPTNGVIHIEITSEISGEIPIEVINSLGQVVWRQKVWNRKTNIDLSNYPPGVYFLNGIVGQQQIRTSFVLTN